MRTQAGSRAGEQETCIIIGIIIRSIIYDMTYFGDERNWIVTVYHVALSLSFWSHDQGLIC